MNSTAIFSEQEINHLLTQFNSSEIKNKNSVELSAANIASYIDHTLLKPEASMDEIKILCEEALQFNFASVCVNSSNTEFCFDLLKGSNVKVCTVIGFPLGSTLSSVKVFEAEEAIKAGAEEIDMVINSGKLKEQEDEYELHEIQDIVLVAKKYNSIVKVILETCLLTDEEKVRACLLCKKAKADFVKTSTGFSKGGATLHDVALMKFVVGDSLKVKASGGIRSLEDAKAMIAAGADRLGTSSGVKIMQGISSNSNY
ncbi:MAG: deoxyribose-phosphate aldolase [Ignavibacteriales bacterium]|nr:deoxyribose-phosphate aldolase [Ignavibacteriales bacterium]